MHITHRLLLALVIILAHRTSCYCEETKVVKSLDGVWKVETVSIGAKPTEEPPKGGAWITFTNAEMIIDDGGNVYRFKYTANATVDPCELDQTITHDGNTFTTKSIYRRQGDTLTIASAMDPGAPRPTSFSADLSVTSLRLLSPGELTKFRQMGEDEAGKAAMVALRKIGARFDMNTNRMVRTVMLSATSVTYEDLKHLASLKELDSLSLVQTPVGSGGMKHLAALNKLRRLNLSMTAVDDAGAQALVGLTRLEVLVLIGTHITDASVDALSKLTRLKEVDLSLTKVTPQGKKRLSQALPDCDVR